MARDWDEYNRVEKRALDLFDQLGYQVYDEHDSSTGKRPMRNSGHEILLLDRLRAAIKRINPWINDNNLNKAVNKIRPAKIQATNLLEANETIYKRLVNHISLRQDLGQGKKHQTVQYIDYENPENNEFIALNQYTVKGNEEIRPDIVIFVNGIPVGVIECKNDATCDEPEEDAITQLRRYQDVRYDTCDEGAEELFYPNQILVAAWKSSASACTIGAPARQYKEWKDPYPYTKEDVAELVNDEVTHQDILLCSMFRKEHLLDLIRNFTVFEQQGNSMVKMMARYQQFRAVEKALDQIKNAEKLEERNGTVWHTQGSGKSLSMLFLALKLRRMDQLGDPTLLIVTDRKDLDNQITGTFQRCGFPNPIQADGVEELKDLITSDSGKTIMTTVHKFQEEERDKYPVLTEDEEVFVMVDEAHRTQYKDLAANMRRALPNACYLGFTGTPIDKEERSTTRTFGNYIDTYTIEESIDDGATLPIKYEGRLPELRVEGRDLNKLFDRVFKGYSDEERKKIKEKYATERQIAEAESRIEKISLDIIDHYENKISPLKAQVVTVSKEAAATYKETLDRLNGPESAVIFSSDKNKDSARVKKYTTTAAKRKELIERFKDPDDSLSFLIVCSMLLTGFDAPVEQVMYLDKPLKEHNLLQAIARVNRRFEEKNYGLVVDYYGVFDYLQEALAIFNKKDVENAVTSVKEEQPRLERRHRKAMSFFADVDLNNLDECVLALRDEDIRAKFKRAFKAFSKSMDIVMPDPIADPYRDDLKTLGKIYKAARNRYRDKNIDIKGVGDKVKRLINNHISATDIKILNEPVSILNKDKFDAVIEDRESDEAKAIEMEHAIKDTISVKMEENPVFYQSLQERLEEIIDNRRQGRLNFTEEIKELETMVNEMRTVKSKAEKLGLNEREFAFYELLMDERETDSTEETSDANQQSSGNESETESNQQIKQLTKELMKSLKEMTVIDWRQKDQVQKDMRREIKLTLAQYPEFKSKLKSLTTRIMKLARKIL